MMLKRYIMYLFQNILRKFYEYNNTLYKFSYFERFTEKNIQK